MAFSDLPKLSQNIEIILDIVQEQQLLIGTFVIDSTKQFWSTLHCIIENVEVYGATFFVLMFNGTGREAQRRLGFGAVCLFQYLYKSYRYLYEQSHSEDMSLSMPICSSQISALSAVTEHVSPQSQGQYSVIQEQPFDCRCSSCQTQFINGVSSQS